jgi:hypothetical protein
MNRVRSSFWLFAAATATFAAAAVHGMSSQTTPPPAASQFRNLKVLPAEIPRDRLMMVMKGFATSLGVRCTFCHVGEEGKPATMDFASDANPHKDVARKMMLMVRRINEQDFAVNDFSQSKVTCYTCHRGAPRPLTTAPPIPAPSAPTATERG